MPAQVFTNQTDFGARGSDASGEIVWLDSGQNPVPVGTTCRARVGRLGIDAPRSDVLQGLPDTQAALAGTLPVGSVGAGAEYSVALLPGGLQSLPLASRLVVRRLRWPSYSLPLSEQQSNNWARTFEGVVPGASVEVTVSLGASAIPTLTIHHTLTPVGAAGHAGCPEAPRDSLLAGPSTMPSGAVPGTRTSSAGFQGEWDIDSGVPTRGAACGLVSALSPRLAHTTRSVLNTTTGQLEAVATLRLRAVGTFVLRAIAVADDLLPSEVLTAVIRVDPPLAPVGPPAARFVGRLPSSVSSSQAGSIGISTQRVLSDAMPHAGRTGVLTPASIPNVTHATASDEAIGDACFAGDVIYCPTNCSATYYTCSAGGMSSAQHVLPSGLVCARGRIEYFGRASLRRGEISDCLGTPGVTLRGDDDYNSFCSAAPDGDYCTAPCSRNVFSCAAGRGSQVVRLG